MNIEEIYQKYPWLKEPTNGNVYTPMVQAATGIRSDINPIDYFEAVVTLHINRFNQEVHVATAEVLTNVGYWAGYFDFDAMEKVKEVYGAEHPIFG